MLQVAHLSNASLLAYQSLAVGEAYKFANQSDKLSKFHSAAAAAGKVADAEIPSQ